MVELKGFGKEEDEGGFLGFFKKKRDKLEAMKTSYAKAEVNVDKIDPGAGVPSGGAHEGTSPCWTRCMS